MGDFVLDLRGREERQRAIRVASCLLTFTEDVDLRVVEREMFSLVLARPDGFDLWGPCEYKLPEGRVFVAIAGRVALDEAEWRATAEFNCEGGAACKAILKRYLRYGPSSLESLNGNFIAFVHDERTRDLYLVTDRCGMYLAYYHRPLDNAFLFCSHPDILATILGESERFDVTSLAEFLTTGKLSFPYTYYENVRALDFGYIYHFIHGKENVRLLAPKRYFEFKFKVVEAKWEEDLAAELAESLVKAVRRRTHARFGRTGIGLSGGIDSRVMVSAAVDGCKITAFHLYNTPNREFRIARAIARACGVDFVPIQREFDYYGNGIEAAARISAGMGSVASNHFLGIRGRLKEFDIENLLTGCYCDYLFKGLALNTLEGKLLRTERIGPFRFSFYRVCYWNRTRFQQEVAARLEDQFPESVRTDLTEEDWLVIERKRTFPLAYEADLAQRVIPQRVLPWYVPVVDNDVVDTYLKIPPRFKLNGSLFKRVALLLCEEAVKRIPDSNTGAPLDAFRLRYSLCRFHTAVCNRLREKAFPRMSTRGSWPNWKYYIMHSRVIEALWERPNPLARDMLLKLVGYDPLCKKPREFSTRDTEFFLRLLTLKAWFERRCGL